MNGLKVHNTLSAKKEDFVPLESGKVRMYACGPTVYNLSHLGHARKEITFDVIQRYLRYIGYELTYVRNITDVDDKIVNSARDLGLRPDQIARRYTYTFWKDMEDLNVASPDVEPRATEFISEMFKFIEELMGQGHAYESEGDVYFDVLSFKNYGKLRKQGLDDLLHGAREQVRSQTELRELKKHPADFALWKSADSKDTGWQSPWGWGRPGWHLECSAMIKKVLGETIDIHGGGEDLIFPHHENEIAQSESLHGGKELAKYWLHNSFLQVDSEKMSKSLGNFETIQSVLANYSPDMIRLFILQTHYRSPIDFSYESMEAAKSGTARLLRAARAASAETEHEEANLNKNGKFNEYLRTGHPCLESLKNDPAAGAHICKLESEFLEAMNNDFNTAQALSLLFQTADLVFAAKDETLAAKYAAGIKFFASVLGLKLEDTSKHIDAKTGARLVDTLLEMREYARGNKDYKQSDLIRNALAELGIKVMDVKGGSALWERD